MPFIHPAIFFTGLAAVSLPILIHILNRRRFKIRDWAAMKFLLDSIRKNRRRLRIEELILLAIRCLVVFLLALVIGRYTGCSAINAGEANGQQTIVFLLDDSVSMGQKQGPERLFSLAVADIADRIEKLGEENKIAVVLTSQPDKPYIAMDFNNRKQEKLNRLAELTTSPVKVSDTVAHLNRAMEAAAKLLGTEGSRQLYVLTDARAVDLNGEQVQNDLKKVFDGIQKQAIQVIVLDYGRAAKRNLTMERIELVDKVAKVGATCKIHATVRNNGTVTEQTINVALRAKYNVNRNPQSVQLPVQTIDSLEPGQSRMVEFDFKCPQAGPAVVSAELPADELSGDVPSGDDDSRDNHGDNRISLAVNVRPALKVLLVDGDMNVTDPEESESFYVQTAIDPFRDGRLGNRYDVVAPNDLMNVTFDDYEMVILMDVPSFPLQVENNANSYPKLTALERYVRNGGGLAIFMGKDVNLAFYNGSFYKNGTGLLPYKIKPSVMTEDIRNPFRLDPRSVEADRLLAFFGGEYIDFVNLIRFERFFPCEEQSSLATSQDVKSPRVLARFTDSANGAKGSPAIVHRQVGLGNVMTFFTTGSSKWTDWPRDESGSFAAVILELLANYARSQTALTDKVGAGIDYPVPAEMADAKCELKLPSFPIRDAVTLVPKMGHVSFADTREAGIYTLEFRQPDGSVSEVKFSRYVDSIEGDLRHVGQAGVTAAFGSSDYTYVSRSSQGGQTVGGASDREYWKWALAALVLMLALEVFLGQRFGHYSN